MVRKIIKSLRNPGKSAPLAIKIIQQQLCYITKGTAFFLQGQMDINPKSRWHNPEFVKQTGGYFPEMDGNDRIICDIEPWDTTRRDMLILLLRTIIENKIDGDFVELGVYKGFTAKLIHYYAPEKKFFLFDTFEGFGSRNVIAEKAASGHTVQETHFSDTSLSEVKNNIAPLNDNVKFYKGYFPESIPKDLGEIKFSFVHLDADLYKPTFNGLNFFYPRVSKGGFIVIHDYNAWPGARKAVDDFFTGRIETPIPMPDKSGSALVLKQ